MAEDSSVEVSAEQLSKQIVVLLKAIQKNITSLTEGRLFGEIWVGAPYLDRTDLSYVALLLWKKIETFDWSLVKETAVVQDVLDRLQKFAAVDINSFLYSSDSGAVSFLTFMSNMEEQLFSQFRENEIKGLLTIPLGLNKNLQAAKQRMNKIESESQDLSAKVKSINSAYQASERLQFTQSELDEALADSISTKNSIKKIEVETGLSKDSAASLVSEIERIMNFAQAALGKADQAYRAATSQGLAKSFSNKAEALNKSMRVWIFGLVVSLCAGGYIGYLRFPEILKSLVGQPDWGVVLANIFLGVMGLAPAVWLAWVSTRQIGQRFKLAEDYGYKAALASAYEGYRAEAAHIDPLFQAQLFAIALGRLDEIPLRVLESNMPGSPLHELLQSSEFKDAVEKVPSLKDKVINLMRPTKEKDPSPAPASPAANADNA